MGRYCLDCCHEMSGDTPGHDRVSGNINTISRGTGVDRKMKGPALGVDRKVGGKV